MWFLIKKKLIILLKKTIFGLINIHLDSLAKLLANRKIYKKLKSGYYHGQIRITPACLEWRKKVNVY